MESDDRNLFLATERFLVQIAAIALAEQPNNLFWLVSLLLQILPLVSGQFSRRRSVG